MSRTVVVELAGQHALARDLVAGGVFVPDTLTYGEDCELVLRGGGKELRLAANVVWVNGDKGSGLQLHGCDAEMKQRIAEMANAAVAGAEAVGDAVTEEAAIEDAPIDDAATDDPAADERAGGADGRAADDPAADDPAVDDPAADDADKAGGNGDDAAAASDRKIALNLHERLRGLPLAQQLKLAHTGEVSERIVLERMYGKAVWEALLRNPRLTGPEVARIARMGALPRPLMEIIVGNGGWLQIPEVRRALLSNPRLATDQIIKILRMLPKHELKLAAMQTAYPHAVRDVAKRILKDAAGG